MGSGGRNRIATAPRDRHGRIKYDRPCACGGRKQPSSAVCRTCHLARTARAAPPRCACGARMEPRSKQCQACTAAAYAARAARICRGCGAAFRKDSNVKSKGWYCTRACAYAHIREWSAGFGVRLRCACGRPMRHSRARCFLCERHTRRTARRTAREAARAVRRAAAAQALAAAVQALAFVAQETRTCRRCQRPFRGTTQCCSVRCQRRWYKWRKAYGFTAATPPELIHGRRLLNSVYVALQKRAADA